MKVFKQEYKLYRSDPYYRQRAKIETRYTHSKDLLQAERLFNKRPQGWNDSSFSVNRVSESSLICEIADMIQKDVYVDNIPEEMDSWSPELEFSDDMITEIIEKVREIED